MALEMPIPRMTPLAEPAVLNRHTGVYPGTFDPVTNGHMDIIGRAARILDRLVVGVAQSAGKAPIFSIEERIELVRAEMDGVAAKTGCSIVVTSFSGLLVDFARDNGAGVIIRGLRSVTDFDYEFQMAGMNYRLDPAIETVFLTASETNQFIASRLVKEIAHLGGDISSFVPALTLERTLARVRPGA
jgi:pantetheine-phosphate adenylyltransferase